MANRVHMKQRNVGLGRGGWHCQCCAPAKKHRTAWCRMAKRIERQATKQAISRELSE